MNAAFVARMEDVLAAYERPCVLHGQPVEPLPPVPARPTYGEQPTKSGRPRRESSTYLRQGTVCLLAASEPGAGQRNGWSRSRPGAPEPATAAFCSIWPPPTRRPGKSGSCGTTAAPTPTPSSTSTCPPPKRGPLAERFGVHYTPKDASWLNMIELEISAIAR